LRTPQNWLRFTSATSTEREHKVPEEYVETAWDRVTDAVNDLFGAAGQDQYHCGDEDEETGERRALTEEELAEVLNLLLTGANKRTWQEIRKVTGGGLPVKFR